MAELSKENLDFIFKHKILLEEVFNATGWKAKDYKEFMKENGYLVAYGVTRCSNGGHDLRTRYGHCVICDPAKIAYVKRKNSSGYVYIAVSLENKLLKVGCAKDYKKRILALNSQHYGNISDWQLVGYSYQDKMGEVEHNIQLQFQDYQVKRPFNKDNKSIEASEIFDINLQDLLNRISELGYKFEFPNQVILQSFLDSNEKNKCSEKQIYQTPTFTIQTNQITNQLSAKEKAELELQREKIDKLIEEGKIKVEEQASIERLVQEQAKTDAIIKEQKRLEEIEKERLRLTKVIEEKNRSEAKKIALEQQERIDSARKPNEFVENTNISSSRTQQPEIERQKTKNKITMIIFIAIIVAILFLIFTN